MRANYSAIGDLFEEPAHPVTQGRAPHLTLVSPHSACNGVVVHMHDTRVHGGHDHRPTGRQSCALPPKFCKSINVARAAPSHPLSLRVRAPHVPTRMHTIGDSIAHQSPIITRGGDNCASTAVQAVKRAHGIAGVSVFRHSASVAMWSPTSHGTGARRFAPIRMQGGKNTSDR